METLRHLLAEVIDAWHVARGQSYRARHGYRAARAPFGAYPLGRPLVWPNV